MERGLCIVRDGPKRTYDAMFRKAKALHITGNKVFGYDNVPVYGSGTNADGTQCRQYVVRKINPQQSKVVVKIFDCCGLIFLTTY